MRVFDCRQVMMPRLRGGLSLCVWSLVTLLLLSVNAPTTWAAEIVLEQDRGVFSVASAADAVGADAEISGDEASDNSDFSATALADAVTTNVDVATTTILETRIAGDLIRASGRAVADAETTAGDARGISHADSFFEILFESSTTGSYFLHGAVAATANLGDGYSSVELTDVTGASQLASFEAAAGQSEFIAAAVVLTAGDKYRLTAFSIAKGKADGGAVTETGDASFAISVPEPSSHLLAASASLTLAAITRRRRKRLGRGPAGARGRVSIEGDRT